MNQQVHSFREQLQFSHELDPAELASLEQFFRQTFPNVLDVRRLDEDSDWQRHGCDWFVRLKNGTEHWIDDKVRKQDYGDVLLEIWSQYYGHDQHPRNKKGWAVDPTRWAHWVAYIIRPTGVCYLLHRDLVRLACRQYYHEWKSRFGFRDARNPTYLTRNIAVPWDELRDACAAVQEQRLKDWPSLPRDKEPIAPVSRFQMTFEFGGEYGPH